MACVRHRVTIKVAKQIAEIVPSALQSGCCWLVNKANLSLDGVHIIWFINQTSDNSEFPCIYMCACVHTSLWCALAFPCRHGQFVLARAPLVHFLLSLSYLFLHPSGNAHVHQCNSFLSRVLLATPLPHFAQKCAPFVWEHYLFHASLLKLQSQSINFSLLSMPRKKVLAGQLKIFVTRHVMIFKFRENWTCVWFRFIGAWCGYFLKKWSKTCK